MNAETSICSELFVPSNLYVAIKLPVIEYTVIPVIGEFDSTVAVVSAGFGVIEQSLPASMSSIPASGVM